MSDQLTDRLTRLAPEIDLPAARAEFDARRAATTGASRPTWFLAAAVAVLLVGGVIGLIVLAGGGTEPSVPADRPDDAVAPTGLEFEVLAVEQGALDFHALRAAVDQAGYEQMWVELGAPFEAPTVDFSRDLVVVLARPDDACPDVLTEFDVDGQWWTPVFEPPPGACNQPLLSWTYVVAVDRAVVGDRIGFRIAADTLFDAPPAEIVVDVPVPTDGPTATAPAVVTPLDLTLPAPPAGEARLHTTTLGTFWLVRHDDGTVSVLPALVDVDSEPAEGVPTGIAALVVPSSDLSSFAGPRWRYDPWGRTIDGPRSDDLAGYVGTLTDDASEVRVATTTADRVAGEPVEPTGPQTYDASAALASAFGDPIDLGTYLSLSSTGLARYLDAGLVVEDGVGTICEVAADVPVPALTGCSGLTVATTVTTTEPDLTTFFHAPILVEFDLSGVATRIVPLGGLSSRNDAFADVPPSEIEVVVESAAAMCRRDGVPIVVTELVAGADTAVNVAVELNGEQLGIVYVEPHDGALTTVEIELTRLPDTEAALLVRFAGGMDDTEIVMATAEIAAPADPGAC